MVYEPTVRNSGINIYLIIFFKGIPDGKFLEKRKYKNP
jgi:hypothetical protein